MIATLLSLVALAVPVSGPVSFLQIQIVDPLGKGIEGATVKSVEREIGRTGSEGWITLPQEPLIVDIVPPPGKGLQGTRLSITQTTSKLTVPWQIPQQTVPRSAAFTESRCNLCCNHCCCYPCYCCCYRRCCCYCCCAETSFAPSRVDSQVNDRAADNAALTISLPEDAVLFINGEKIPRTGPRREYFSTGMKPSLTYTYVVRAELLRNGTTLKDTKTLSLSPGDNKSLILDFSGKEVASAVSAR